MTDNTTEVEFWIAVDDDGNFIISTDGPQEANDELVDGNTCHATKVFAVKLKLPLPKVTEVAATLPDTDRPVTVTVNSVNALPGHGSTRVSGRGSRRPGASRIRGGDKTMKSKQHDIEQAELDAEMRASHDLARRAPPSWGGRGVQRRLGPQWIDQAAITNIFDDPDSPLHDPEDHD